jgi:hypothetical protein
MAGQFAAGVGGEGDSFDGAGGRGMHGNRDKASGFRDGFAADDFLSLADDGDSGRAGVLGERDDQHR